VAGLGLRCSVPGPRRRFGTWRNAWLTLRKPAHGVSIIVGLRHDSVPHPSVTRHPVTSSLRHSVPPSVPARPPYPPASLPYCPPALLPYCLTPLCSAGTPRMGPWKYPPPGSPFLSPSQETSIPLVPHRFPLPPPEAPRLQIPSAPMRIPDQTPSQNPWGGFPPTPVVSTPCLPMASCLS
jgi:hypothetical protein